MGAPFFIVGASRSGTTMLRLLLNAHPNIGVPKELAYFERCARFTELERWKSLALNPADYQGFVRGFLQKKKLALEGIDVEQLEKEIIGSGPPDLARPFRMTMDAWAHKEGKTTWGEKTPKNLFYVDIIQEMLPDTKFVYIIRDPRAVVYSMNRFARFQDDSVLNAFNWLQAATKGYKLLMEQVPANRRHILKYEDLVADVEATTRSLCAFLEEPFDEGMLEFYQKSRTNIHPHSKELGGVKTLTQPITTVSVDKWRNGLTSTDIANVEAVCEREMKHFGYELTGEQLTGVHQAKLFMKMSYCNWQQRRNKHLRAYQIAFKPFDKTRERVRNIFSR